MFTSIFVRAKLVSRSDPSLTCLTGISRQYTTKEYTEK